MPADAAITYEIALTSVPDGCVNPMFVTADRVGQMDHVWLFYAGDEVLLTVNRPSVIYILATTRGTEPA